MKKSVSTLLLLTLVSGVVLAGGIEDPKAVTKVAVMKKGNNLIQLFYKSERSANVEVAIYNEKNELRFKETIRKSVGFSRPYNMSELSQGTYRIVVSDGTQRFEETITTAEAVPQMLSHKVALEDNKFMLMVSNAAPQKIQIEVVDKEGKVLFKGTESPAVQHSKVFSVENAVKGGTITITNGLGEVQLVDF